VGRIYLSSQPHVAVFQFYKKRTWSYKNIHGILGLQTVRPTPHYNTTVHWYSDVLKLTLYCGTVCYTVIAVNIYILYYNVTKKKKLPVLFSKIWTMVDTVNLLMFGCTLCPASLMLIPWRRTWSWISFVFANHLDLLSHKPFLSDFYPL